MTDPGVPLRRWSKIAPKAAEKASYFSLVDRGVSNAVACGIVGVDLRTGQRWSNARRAGLAGAAATEADVEHNALTSCGVVGGGRFLSEAERVSIADRLVAGCSIRQIADELGRAPSTISREVRRNAAGGGYRPFAAHGLAAMRRRRPKPGKIASNPQLAAVVVARLKQRWSPEQISHTLAMEHPHDPEMRVAHETIYQALFVQGRGALRIEIADALRSGRTRRKPHRGPGERRPRFNGLMISERPAEAEDRAVPGHWEGDLIIGAGSRSAIGTLVERSTRYVMLIHLPNGTRAEAVRDGLISTIGSLPAHLKRSLTWTKAPR